jgi:hypothetical protein
VFKATLLSIVLLLAVGQNVALLCSTWCRAHTMAASECHHQSPASSASVAADDTCSHGMPAVPTFVREDMRRGIASPDANHAIPVPGYAFARLRAAGHPDQGPWRAWLLETRPRTTPLRI